MQRIQHTRGATLSGGSEIEFFSLQPTRCLLKQNVRYRLINTGVVAECALDSLLPQLTYLGNFLGSLASFLILASANGCKSI